MDYCPIALNNPDWISIRQALSLSLASCRPAAVRDGGAFLKHNEKFIPVMEDLKGACRTLNAGTLDYSGSDIVFTPQRPVSGTCEVKSGKFSSSMEVVLFVLPALFELDFRTVLNITGVTNSPVSCSTGFVREGLYGFLEQAGLYASMSLRRYGFYGSGEGSLEVRAYPAERKKGALQIQKTGLALEGARILFSGVQPELAKREKQRLRDALSLPDEKVSILEIRNAAGFGNSLEAYLRSGNSLYVISREMAFYDHTGDFIFDETSCNYSINEFIGEVNSVLQYSEIPFPLYRELLPFCGPDVTAAGCEWNDSEQTLLNDINGVYAMLMK